VVAQSALQLLAGNVGILGQTPLQLGSLLSQSAVVTAPLSTPRVAAKF